MRRLIPLLILVSLLGGCDPGVEVEFRNLTDGPVYVVDEVAPSAGNVYAAYLEAGASRRGAWLGRPGWDRRVPVKAFDAQGGEPGTPSGGGVFPYVNVNVRDRELVFCRIYSLHEISEEPVRVEIVRGVIECPDGSSTPTLIVPLVSDGTPEEPEARRTIEAVGRLAKLRHDLAATNEDAAQNALTRALDTLSAELGVKL